MNMKRLWTILTLVALGALAASAGEPQGSKAYLIGAGDIAKCGDRLKNAEATARILDDFFSRDLDAAATIFTLGDNAYTRGTSEQFRKCYEATWGRHKERTRPAIGNHDYKSKRGQAYFDYFGAAAGDRDKGYYSYDLGDWHIVVLNTQCKKIGGCIPGSPQYEWLRKDLESHDNPCTLAYGHHPVFSSGKHGGHKNILPLFRLLYEHNADVYLSGHDHNYERFAPQNFSGQLDADRGIRQFVVGTGGRELRRIGAPKANSETTNRISYGVLKLTLHPDRYEWEFLPVEGGAYKDSGEGSCH